MTRQEVIDAIAAGKSLSGADLNGADLWGADLSGADLSGADLRRADLSGANISGADLDFAVWPLWCGSLDVILDERLQRQLVYHALAVAPDAPGITDALREWANKFHRVENGDVPALAGKDIRA